METKPGPHAHTISNLLTELSVQPLVRVFLTAPSRAVPELLDSSVCQPGRVSIPPGKESCLGPSATVRAEKNIQESTAQLCPFSQEEKK